MSGSPIQYAALLRRELCARNASYAALHQLSHVTSYGDVPIVVYQPSPCGTQHGNFISASYRALQRRPQSGNHELSCGLLSPTGTPVGKVFQQPTNTP
jgi:hypothetical protein